MDAQFKKGVLELCVLSKLVDDDKYGYELTEDISQELSITAGIISLKQVYPINKNKRTNGYPSSRK